VPGRSAGAERRRSSETSSWAVRKSQRGPSTGTAVLPRPADIFVGRSELIETLAETRPGGRGWILDTFGLYGSGKTKFLERIREELPERRPTLTFEVTLGPDDRPRGADSAQDLVRAYVRFRNVLGGFVARFVDQEEGRTKEAAERAMEPFQAALEVAHQSVAPMKVDQRIGGLWNKFDQSSLGTVKAEFGDTWMVHEIETRRPELTKKFAAALGPALRGRTAVITIDGFEWIADGELGSWLLELVNCSCDTVAVVARTPAAVLPSTPETDVVTTLLPPLTRKEVSAVLCLCLQVPAVDDRLVDVVARFSKGHARTVGLVAELLQRLEPAEVEPDSVKRLLRGLPDDLAKEHGDLVDAILDRDRAGVAELVRTCSLLRRFDAALLEAVAGVDEGKGAAAIDDLRRYSFVDAVDDPRGGFFAIHDFIRAELERRLVATDPDGARARHEATAAHIGRWLAEYEEGEAPEGRKTYGAWYRYERPEWRAAGLEWLYHEARAAGGGSAKRDRRARLRLARLFFDGFWWWGCYREFPAIRELLADWRETQPDVAWTSHLIAFLDAYPTGYEKDGDPERWAQVERSLRLVRAACGLAGNPAKHDEEERHVRGLMANFSAHAARYSRPSDDAVRGRGYEKAVASYDEAAATFGELEDDWDLAWTLFERGELHHEHGEAAAAEADWRAVVELLPELGDDELTANMHRLAADARWRHAPADAFALHGHAILHAYLFQGRYQGVRYRPDAYTLDFYAEQVERAIVRLVHHASTGGDVEAAVADLRAPWPADGAVDADEVRSLCDDGDRAGLALLFPDPPSEVDLERDESLFLEQWEEKLATVGEPDAVVPPDAW